MRFEIVLKSINNTISRLQRKDMMDAYYLYRATKETGKFKNGKLIDNTTGEVLANFTKLYNYSDNTILLSSYLSKAIQKEITEILE